MRIYQTVAERAEFDPGPCPRCGQKHYRVNWIDVPTRGDLPPYPAIPGTITCLNSDCPSNQPPRMIANRSTDG